MKNKFLPIVLAVITIFCGCNSTKKTDVPQTFSNVTVTTSSSSAAKFPVGSKYAFVTFISQSDEDTEVTMVNQRIQTSLSSELKKKGYVPGEYANISFFVSYTVEVQPQIDILVGKSKSQGNEWISAVIIPGNYVSGALLIQIIDAESMEPVWLGVFDADIMRKAVSEKEKQERVKYAVRELLKTFQPK